MNNKRKQQLLDLGFEDNSDQQSFISAPFMDGGHIYIDYWLIEEVDSASWNNRIRIWTKELTQERKNRTYRRALFSYGVTPLLLLMEQYETAEDYTECALILNVINKVNEEISAGGERLETRFSEDSLENLRYNCNKLGVRGDIAIANTMAYVEAIKDMVNENN